MLDLRSLQRTFLRAITDPDGVEAALWDAGRRGRELELALAGDARLDGVGRLRIYADMVAARLRETLALTFPVVARVVGDEPFVALAAAYFAACPSRHPSLREAGARFADFLACGGEPGWLVDLARLEWARVDVFDELDEPLLDEAALRALDPEAFIELPIALAAAHRLVELDHDVLATWRGDGDGASDERPARPTPVLVWREDVSVYHRALDPLEAELLRRLSTAAAPIPFGELCERIVDEVGEEAASARAFGLLAHWVQAGLIRHPTP